jgi:hypothetical protein
MMFRLFALAVCATVCSGTAALGQAGQDYPRCTNVWLPDQQRDTRAIIIGVPGDVVRWERDGLFVNGQRVENVCAAVERGAIEGLPGDVPAVEEVVASDRYFVTFRSLTFDARRSDDRTLRYRIRQEIALVDRGRIGASNRQ